jgi:CHAT domain-containing protein
MLFYSHFLILCQIYFIFIGVHHNLTELKKIIIFGIILLTIYSSNKLKAQNSDIRLLFQKFAGLYKSGDLLHAEETLYLILSSNLSITDEYKVAVYNNLGVVNLMLGRYGKALEFNNRADSMVSLKKQNSKELADIYNNRAYIYNVQKSFDLAIKYLEKSIRIYNNLNDNDDNIILSLSSIYLNIGIAYLETKNYKLALDFFNKSAEIKTRMNFPGLPLVYLNIAKTYIKIDSPSLAEKYYLKSISSFKNTFGENYYRLAEVYLDFGLFLRTNGRNEEALDINRKALSICLENYGNKHTLVSLSYKHLGDNYVILNDIDSALIYYQKSIIAVVKDFDKSDIFSNPSIDSAIFDIRLLDNLKSKSQALELLADEQHDLSVKYKAMKKSLETIELALQLIDRIRNNYLSEESRIYLAENEKETYVNAIHIAFSLYSLSHEGDFGIKMYDIAKKSKAAVLRNEILENDFLYSPGVPDSIRKKQNSLAGNIAAYDNLILQEIRKTDPDSNKLSFWKDAIFDMNRELEKVKNEISTEFPEYHNLLHRTEPLSLHEMQKHLKSDETVVEFMLSNQYKNGKRKLYTFLITKDKFNFRETNLDSSFSRNAEKICYGNNPGSATDRPIENFKKYTDALYYMYENLIKANESFFNGSRIIIVPDEEIAWLPFDAFIKVKPLENQIEYEGLQYLLNYYTFSYGYSSSLIFNENIKIKRDESVFAFSPGYGKKTKSGKEFEYLGGAGQEIESIFKWFKGKKFTGEEATETNFSLSLQYDAIFHLAMHTSSDSINSKYSFFIFDSTRDTIEDGKLYNYEISLRRLKSPMVVLSACNSGTGTLSHGEGLMSLARGFILAGASSVIKTTWDVNDDASAKIITSFYYFLSKGKPKDEAMRLSKLEYLKTSPPVYTDPYYWAAYEVMGANDPVIRNGWNLSVWIVIIMSILATGSLMIYFMRRRIFSDRS